MSYNPIGKKFVLVDALDNVSSIKEVGECLAVKEECGYKYYKFKAPNIGPYNKLYCFPVEYKEQITEIVKTRQQLKKQYDDSMGLVYQLLNTINLDERFK